MYKDELDKETSNQFEMEFLKFTRLSLLLLFELMA